VESSQNVTLLHKPRGSKGIWQPVERASKIRVTKGKGKRLKLKLGITYGQDYDLQVFLIDIEKDLICKDGFSIESAKTVQDLIEMDVKLFKVCKPRLQFSVQITNKEGKLIVGKSIEFATHNSGTVNIQSKEKKSPLNSTKSEKRKSSVSPVQEKRSEEKTLTSSPPISTNHEMSFPNHINTNNNSIRMQIHNNGVILQLQEPQQTQWFNCQTCGTYGNDGMCILCAVERHQDHVIKYAGVTDSLCKCQKNKHQPVVGDPLSKRSRLSLELLAEKISSGLQLPESN